MPHLSLCRICGIVLGLGMPKNMVYARLIGKQRLVAAGLDDFAGIEYRDLVAEATGGQAVGDEQGGFGLGHLQVFQLNPVL